MAEKASVNPKLCKELKLNAKKWNGLQKVEIKSIDEKVAKAKQNKMADKLVESNNVLVPSLQENTKNKNTQKKHKHLA